MAMPHECSIYRTQYGRTEYGGDTETRPEIAKNVKCFIQNMGISDRERWAKAEFNVDTKIYFIDEPPLKEGDFIVITRNDQGPSYIGHTFKFRAIDDSSAGFSVIWKAVCKRETNPIQPNPPQ
jgi:hypothetical protein